MSIQTVPLRALADINMRKLLDSTPKNQQLRYIDISSVTKTGFDGKYQEYNFEHAPSRARRLLKDGSTIVATVRTYLKAVAYFPEPKKGVVVSTGFAVLDPKPSINPKYLYYKLVSDDFVQQVEANSDGVSYPAINPSKMATLRIAYESDTLQQGKIVDCLDDKIGVVDKMLVTKNHTHTHTYQSSTRRLLQMPFSAAEVHL